MQQLTQTISELIQANEYDKAAETFLNQTGSKLTVKYLKYDYHFPGDARKRDIYRVTLSRKIAGKVRKMSFNFGASLNDTNSGKDLSKGNFIYYSVLACLTKYDPETFEDFCSNYGYDTDSRTAERIYRAAVKEYESLTRLYTPDELEAMAEIQ